MPRTSTCRAMLAAVAISLLLALASARAETGENGHGALRGPLDGLSFVGVFGPESGSDDRDDVLYFDDGQFWSEKCVPCGFKPGPYWVRFDDGAVHFRGVLESDDRGRFTYVGVVRDEAISVKINWRHDRWYWTIDKDFRFEGKLTDMAPAIAAAGATRIALAAEPDPDRCTP